MKVHIEMKINPWPNYLVHKLRKLHEEGLSFIEIAEMLDVSRNSAIGKANRLGLKRRPVMAKIDSVEKRIYKASNRSFSFSHKQTLTKGELRSMLGEAVRNTK